jgi:glycine cleavage system H protein
MQIEGFEFPDDLYYDKLHDWARVEGNTVVQGITDFAQVLAKEIVFAEVPRTGREVEQGNTFMSMESGKWVGRIYAAVSGKIAEANEELEFDPTIINSAPYGDGWLAKIEAKDLGELSNLFRASDPEFQAWVKEEKGKYLG